jgi:hypothetical protein
MKTAHKIRMNPTSEQVEYLKRACGTRRFIYNWGREQWEKQYQAYKAEQEIGPEEQRVLKPPNALALKKHFNEIREALGISCRERLPDAILEGWRAKWPGEAIWDGNTCLPLLGHSPSVRPFLKRNSRFDCVFSMRPLLLRYAVNFAVKSVLARRMKRMKPGGKGVDEVIYFVGRLSNRNHRAGLKVPGTLACAEQISYNSPIDVLQART